MTCITLYWHVLQSMQTVNMSAFITGFSHNSSAFRWSICLLQYLATLDDMEDLSNAAAQHIAATSSSKDIVDVPSSSHDMRRISDAAPASSSATKQQKPHKMGYRSVGLSC